MFQTPIVTMFKPSNNTPDTKAPIQVSSNNKPNVKKPINTDDFLLVLEPDGIEYALIYHQQRINFLTILYKKPNNFKTLNDYFEVCDKEFQRMYFTSNIYKEAPEEKIFTIIKGHYERLTYLVHINATHGRLSQSVKQLEFYELSILLQYQREVRAKHYKQNPNIFIEDLNTEYDTK